MRLILLIFTVFLISSCGIKPWVQPYERAFLADPIMSLSKDPISDSYIRHVTEVREAARGAAVGSGGGCGCN